MRVHRSLWKSFCILVACALVGVPALGFAHGEGGGAADGHVEIPARFLFNVGVDAFTLDLAGESSRIVVPTIHADLGGEFVDGHLDVLAGFSFSRVNVPGATGAFNATALPPQELTADKMDVLASVGVRYNILQPIAGAAVPSLMARAEVGRSLVGSIDGIQDKQGATLAGFLLAFGVEYLFNDHLSLGGQLGLRYSRVLADDDTPLAEGAYFNTQVRLFLGFRI